jgi:hypothetical protein
MNFLVLRSYDTEKHGWTDDANHELFPHPVYRDDRKYRGGPSDGKRNDANLVRNGGHDLSQNHNMYFVANS